MFEAADVSLTYTIKDYVIYVNGEMIDIISYLDDSFTPITSYKLSSLVANSNYHIKLVARNYRGVVMYEVETDFKTLE
ncbi:MAG: fibronectin type III domain-containing protein [Christensenellales bacterium]